jgi:hypothetical protein
MTWHDAPAFNMLDLSVVQGQLVDAHNPVTSDLTSYRDPARVLLAVYQNESRELFMKCI